MRQTLTEMITPTETQRRNASEKHLRPTNNRHDLPHDTVRKHKYPSDPSLSALFKVQLEIDA